MPAPQPQTRKTITRDEIIRLGQSGAPWDFLALAARGLRQSPGDDGLRFLTAANLARLGFVTPARAHLAMLPPAATAHPDIAGLGPALSGLPNDVVPTELVLETCRANVQVLSRRGIDLSPDVQEWERAAGCAVWIRSLEGMVIRAEAGAWIPTKGDVRSMARAWVKSLTADSFSDACIVEGIDPPWALVEAWNATRPTALGHSPGITLIQRDVRRFLDALASRDLRDILADERVEILLGPHAGGRLASLLSSRFDRRLPRGVFTTPGTRELATPAVGLCVRLALDGQSREHVRLRDQVTRLYAGRDGAYWAGRFRGSLAGGEPLRVLIPTCRYSTFVRHSAGDLAAALARAGHGARILIEPDPHSNLSSIAYLRAFADFRPDLVVLINHPRAMMGESIPANVPYVCWVQDAMPHLFARSARHDGPLDFYLGHVYREFFERHACRADRSLPVPVVADAAKFHPGPVAPAERERFACEVACVTHHSETPEAMHTRLAAEMERTSPGIAPTLDALRARVGALAADAATKNLHTEIDRAGGELLRAALGREPDPAMKTILLRAYAVPLADRFLRHETLAWAADLCESRGWRLRLYGKGWGSHPTLARYAAGELSHGEELRAAYRSAAAHLHVSATTLVHQRAFECLLSGGLCLPRVHADGLSGASGRALSGVIDLPPDRVDEEGRRSGYLIAKHPALAHLVRLKSHFGVGVEGDTLWVRHAKIAGIRSDRERFMPAHDADWVYSGLAEIGFATRDQLGALLTRAVTDPAWRAEAQERACRRVREHFTHDALAPRLISFVADALAKDAPVLEAA